MNALLGPLDSEGRVPARQQTRLSAFLISAHGALARQFTRLVPLHFRFGPETELHAQLYRETEIVSLLMHATSWVFDPELLLLSLQWEVDWLPQSGAGFEDQGQALLVDAAALGHALHAAIRPAALLPADTSADDPFVAALRRIEFESSRMMQAQILSLKDSQLLPVRAAVTAAVERRHRQVRRLWKSMLKSMGLQGACGCSRRDC